MVHYRKQLWGVFHYVVLSVLRELTVGHIATGRLHVTENVFPDVWLVESSETRLWRHHRPQLVEFIDPRMLFEEEHFPVHQMLEHTKIDVMKDIYYANCRRGDAFIIPEDPF